LKKDGPLFFFALLPPKALEDGGDEIAGGMVLGISDDPGLASEPSHHLALGHRLFRIVRALAVDVRPEPLENLRDVVGFEHEHDVDTLERSHELGSLLGGKDGPAGTLSPFGCPIPVHRHHEKVSLFARRAEIANVTDVDEVEVTVRENDPPSMLPRLLDESFGPGKIDDSSRHGFRPCSIAPESSSRDTVAVPRFITTIPPA